MQADAHSQDRIEIRTGENGRGSYLDPILAVPPLRGARRIWSGRYPQQALRSQNCFSVPLCLRGLLIFVLRALRGEQAIE
jgi:hypothetical protein